MAESGQNARWCEEMYDHLAHNLVLYGRSLGLAHSEAEDVLQDTFGALLKLKAEPEKPEHYTFRAYRNRALNYRRSWWRRLRAEMEAAHWFEPDSIANPTEASALHCLAELPVEQREVIVLKLWQRMTFEEIGNILEISPNTAAGRYRYGVEKIRRNLTEIGEDHEHSPCETLIRVEVAPRKPRA